MTFTVAIIGRPNVGKSTLFNRLVGRRMALVDDSPGVTRDRREGDGRLGDLTFTVIDTAGLEIAAAETLSGRMRAQTETAIKAADLVLFLFDARTGATSADKDFAALLRRSDRPFVLVANKSEGKVGSAGALEGYDLGLGEPVAISAEHGDGFSDLYDAVRAALPEHTQPPVEDDEDDAEYDEAERDKRPLRVAIVGRPNVGKSTLINRLLGEDRLLTGPEAGITRDTITVPLERDGRTYLLHDTAGMRRKGKVEEKLEKLSVGESLNAIRFAEVVVVMMDATQPFEDQDLRIADLVAREGRALVIAVNKWDLMEKRGGAIAELREEADRWLPQVKGMPIVAVSGKQGEGLDRLLQAIAKIHEIWNKRVSTNVLNRWLEDTLSAHPPPAVSGRRLRLTYITQPKTRPPTFVISCTRADALPESYKRYLINGLRETFDMPGTPMRLILREKNNPYAGRVRR